MARDSRVRKLISEKAMVYGDKKLANALVRAFDFICDIEQPDGCLSTSVALLVVMRLLGYEPKLCYGLCVSPEQHEYYHVWIEYEGRVLDLAIYGNSHYSSYWLDGPLDPVVFEEKNTTAVQYRDQCFDEEWQYCNIHYAVTTLSIKTYIENAPYNGMWRLICRMLNETLTPARIQKIAEKVEDEPLLRD